MIKADDLLENRPPVRYANAKITLEVIQRAVKDVANRDGIPVAFKRDEVKSGGFLNSTVEDCLVVYHPEHEKDYYGFCFRLSKQGVYTFVSVNYCGESKQLQKAAMKESFAQMNRAERMSNRLLGVDASSDPNRMGAQVGRRIAQFAMTRGVNKQKMEQEQMYYACMDSILDELLV